MAGTFTNLNFHLIFSTKNRDTLIHPDFQDDLYAYMGGIVRGEGGSCLQIGGMADHVHLAVRLKPSNSLSDLMQKVKGNSSSWLNNVKKVNRHFGWQDGYGAFSVSESQLHQVMRYIQKQAEHHRHRSFQEEFLGFLERHGVAYDTRYIWR